MFTFLSFQMIIRRAVRFLAIGLSAYLMWKQQYLFLVITVPMAFLESMASSCATLNGMNYSTSSKSIGHIDKRGSDFDSLIPRYVSSSYSDYSDEEKTSCFGCGSAAGRNPHAQVRLGWNVLTTLCLMIQLLLIGMLITTNGAVIDELTGKKKVLKLNLYKLCFGTSTH